MINVYIDIHDPTINLKKMQVNDPCLLLEITSEQNIVSQHFENRAALEAYVGLLQIALGQVKS